MDYLMMIAEAPATSAADAARRMTAHETFATEHPALDAGRFRPRGEGLRVGASGAEPGSFDDAFDRYYWLRAANLAQAVALANDLPLGDGDRVDVRPLIDGEPHADKLDHPGKVFAFSVLGAAPDEPVWTELMETIARETEAAFPADRFAGGLRLRPPSTGKRIVLDQTKRRVLDGPFVESKEVIGGLFFLRMTSLDEAARWAAASRFLAHGALEIRELWRT